MQEITFTSKKCLTRFKKGGKVKVFPVFKFNRYFLSYLIYINIRYDFDSCKYKMHSFLCFGCYYFFFHFKEKGKDAFQQTEHCYSLIMAVLNFG